MFEANNNIIVVDNNPKHLETLAGKFWEQGFGCRPFEYDPFFNQHLTGIRICFFDVNLEDIADAEGNQPKVFATLAAAIKGYVSKENGPYALIFWTDKGELVENFKKFVSERYANDFPVPYWVTHIDKVEFLEPEADLWTKVTEVFSDKTIGFLFDFESRARNAVAQTINQLYEALPLNTWTAPDEFRTAFDRSLSSIAVNASGFSHAKANPELSVLEGLTPVISHNVLKAKTGASSWVEALETLQKAKKIVDVTFPEKSIQRKLNSAFHIDERVSSIETRGAVVYLDKSRFDLIHTQQYAEWFSDLIPGARKGTRNESTLIAIEVSASCDFSNDKKRTPKYILGVVIPPIEMSQENKQRMSANSTKLGEFNYVGSEIQIWVNLNFVISSLPAELSPELKFGLKKEMMDYVGNRYANHVSRIGVTSF